MQDVLAHFERYDFFVWARNHRESMLFLLPACLPMPAMRIVLPRLDVVFALLLFAAVLRFREVLYSQEPSYKSIIIQKWKKQEI